MLFVMWTASQSYSQTDTTKDTRPVTLPFWVATEIAVDLEEKDRLDRVVKVQVLGISNLQSQISTYELILTGKNASLELKDRFINILQTQYDALKETKDPKYTFNDFLKDAGKVLIGVAVGVVGILVI